jgi:hypothetical protein
MVRYFCKKQKIELFGSECELCFKNGPQEYPTRAACVFDNAKRLDKPQQTSSYGFSIRRKPRKIRSDKGKKRKVEKQIRKVRSDKGKKRGPQRRTS